MAADIIQMCEQISVILFQCRVIVSIDTDDVLRHLAVSHLDTTALRNGLIGTTVAFALCNATITPFLALSVPVVIAFTELGKHLAVSDKTVFVTKNAAAAFLAAERLFSALAPGSLTAQILVYGDVVSILINFNVHVMLLLGNPCNDCLRS